MLSRVIKKIFGGGETSSEPEDESSNSSESEYVARQTSDVTSLELVEGNIPEGGSEHNFHDIIDNDSVCGLEESDCTHRKENSGIAMTDPVGHHVPGKMVDSADGDSTVHHSFGATLDSANSLKTIRTNIEKRDEFAKAISPVSASLSRGLEKENVIEATIFTLVDTNAKMFLPRSSLVFGQTALLVVGSSGVDLSLEYRDVCSIRQHLPHTAQLLHRLGSEFTEYGLLFDNSRVVFKFRDLLLLNLTGTANELLGESFVSVAVYDPDTKEFRPFAKCCRMQVNRRSSDGLSLLSVFDQNNPDILLFQSELTHDVQFWSLQEDRQFGLFGPYIERGRTAVRSLLLFELVERNGTTPAEDLLRILSRLVGFESKILEELNQFETTRPIELADELEMQWESDSESYEKEVVQDLDKTRRQEIIEHDPAAKLHKFMQVGEGLSLICRANEQSTWSTGRACNKKADFSLQMYDCNSAFNKLADIPGDKVVYSDRKLKPQHGILHDQESKLLMMDAENRTSLYYMDLAAEKVIQEIKTDDLNVDLMWNSFKGGNCSMDPTFMCANNSAFFLMDTRQSHGQGHTMMYKTNPRFTAAISDENGHILLGNSVGELRLYDGEANKDGKFKIAKTKLDSVVREPIKSVDSTPDGSWILATMKSCIVVYPTRLKGGGNSAFETRLANKTTGIYLRLKHEDILEYGLMDINFQPAVFDDAGHSILTSTGNLAVVWDFKSVRSGRTDKYSIRVTHNYIKDSKALQDGSVIVAYPKEFSIFGCKPKSEKKKTDVN